MEGREIPQGQEFEATIAEEPLFTEYPDIPFQTSQPEQTIPAGETFTKPAFTKVPLPPATKFTATHESPQVKQQYWMNLFEKISSLGTQIEKLVLISDHQFYSIEDHMDRYQANFTTQIEQLQRSFTTQFKHLQMSFAAQFDQYQAATATYHAEMMAYLGLVFPSTPPQP